MNAEYRWEVFSGLDMALFADAGKVYMQKSDLNLNITGEDGARVLQVCIVIVRRFTLILAFISALEIPSALPAAGQTFLSDDPVAEWPQPRNSPLVKPRRINEYYDFFQNIIRYPPERWKYEWALRKRLLNLTDT